jgi:protein-S-isoprenylcysteine O-methyltransferase Ste14
MILQTSASLVFIGVVLFLSAGDWAWKEAWVYLAAMAMSSFALGFWLIRYDPALVSSRLSFPIQKDQRTWDLAFMALALVAFVAWLALMGVDAQRFAWSETSPWCEVVGLILIALCMLICWRVFHANSYAAPQVLMQGRRDHGVISGGPYRFIRHPMYAGALLYFLGVPLLLGSWCAFVLFPLLAIGLGVRAVGEERMLRSRLTDYDIYMRHVRFRFIPYVW